MIICDWVIVTILLFARLSDTKMMFIQKTPNSQSASDININA
jgi:uncharacterized protein YdeI (YjbR/CyaY-like superfamily)